MTILWILLGLLLVAALLIAVSVAPGRAPQAGRQAFAGYNCAHRGLHTEDQSVPENSLAAFRAAAAAGYGVELDVQLSKDGTVVVFHDDDLLRACEVEGDVNEYNWAELREMRLFGTTETIPLFTDVLDVLGNAPVIVELKTAGAKNAELCRKTLDILRAQGQVWCIESFDPRIVMWFRKNAPDVLRGQLAMHPRYYKNTSRLIAFVTGNLLTNLLARPHFVAYGTGEVPFTVRLCYAMGVMRVIWTVRPPADYEKLERENDAVIFEYYNPKPRYMVI